MTNKIIKTLLLSFVLLLAVACGVTKVNIVDKISEQNNSNGEIIFTQAEQRLFSEFANSWLKLMEDNLVETTKSVVCNDTNLEINLVATKDVEADGVKIGDKVQFKVIKENGKYNFRTYIKGVEELGLFTEGDTLEEVLGILYEVTFVGYYEDDYYGKYGFSGKLLREPTAPTKFGYIFEGWYKDEALTNKWDFAVDKVTKNTTLYAKWRVAVNYKATFNSNGGAEVNEINAVEGTLLTEPQEPTKTDYAFEGWYKESGLTNKWDFGTDKITGDITLYAKWILVPNGFVYVAKGVAGTSGISIAYSFYISKTEVTQSQYQSITGNAPSYFGNGSGGIVTNNPVEQVTWYDAVMYANLLSEKEGLVPYYNITNIVKTNKRITSAVVSENKESKGYRLPTVNEWDYAERGGKKSNNYTFSGSDILNEVAWYIDNSSSKTHTVKQKKPNELGIYDMSGNVEEWTNESMDPDTPTYVVGGGTYDWDEYYMEFDGGLQSSGYEADAWWRDLGFRLVRPY